MRRFKLFLIVLVAAIGVLCVSTSSFASTLFADNFDSQPSAYVNHDTYDQYGATDEVDAAPRAASVGTWNCILGNPVYAQVTDSTASPDPTPFSGPNDLRIGRGSARTSVYGTYAAQSTVGDRIHTEMEVYAPALTLPMLYLQIDADHSAFAVMGNSDGSVNDVNGNAISGLSFAAGAWQKWQVDYTVGGAAATVQIGSTSGSSPILTGGTSSGVAQFDLTTNARTPAFYVDNVVVTDLGQVPEPSSIVLLVSALLGLMAYAWRKR